MLVSGRVSSKNQVKFFDGLMWWLRRVAKHSHRPCHAETLTDQRNSLNGWQG